jgi:UDP:flavonoid glycosyltransferase YjiC (YdhE family)
MSIKVLVCPLDWGLGHATRDVMLIRELLYSGYEVTIGADKAPLRILRENFPELPYLVIPSFEIKYPYKGSWMVLKMFANIPKILLGIFREHQMLKKIIKANNFQMVISDNRYGLFGKKIYSIFITHQLRIQLPYFLKWAGFILQFINYRFIKRFNECWIPDFAGSENLSGILSHPSKIPSNAKYIGLLSRFRDSAIGPSTNLEFHDNYDILIILSGPEPQRGILERKLSGQLAGTNYRVIMVLGKPEHKIFERSANITIINHLNSNEMELLISKIPIVIARAGYSTMMDLACLNKTAIIIPTPGQTEQEYLGLYSMKKKWFYYVDQKTIDINRNITSFKKFSPEPFPDNPNILKHMLLNFSLNLPD